MTSRPIRTADEAGIYWQRLRSELSVFLDVEPEYFKEVKLCVEDLDLLIDNMLLPLITLDNNGEVTSRGIEADEFIGWIMRLRRYLADEGPASEATPF